MCVFVWYLYSLDFGGFLLYRTTKQRRKKDCSVQQTLMGELLTNDKRAHQFNFIIKILCSCSSSVIIRKSNRNVRNSRFVFWVKNATSCMNWRKPNKHRSERAWLRRRKRFQFHFQYVFRISRSSIFSVSLSYWYFYRDSFDFCELLDSRRLHFVSLFDWCSVRRALH